jgi:hypothetical protein
MSIPEMDPRRISDAFVQTPLGGLQVNDGV